MNIEQLAALARIATPPHHAVQPSAQVLCELAGEELIEPCEQGYQLAERGRVYLNHVLALPLPTPVNAWRMPSALERAIAEHSPILDDRRLPASATHEDTAPPRPPPPKPIHGITPATDPDERMRQAVELLDRGFGLNEVAETLLMDAGAIERHCYPGGP